MKSYQKYIATGLVSMLAATGALAASLHITSYDAAPAIRFYPLTTNQVRIVTSVSNISVIVGTTGAHTNALLLDATTNTIGEVSAWLATATNAAGTRVIKVDSSSSLSGDVCNSNELFAGTVTNTGTAAGLWTSVPWDTSIVKFYDVSLPTKADGGRSGLDVGGKITQIYGNPAGTGAAVAYVYIDGELVWTAGLAVDSSDVVTALPLTCNIPFGPRQVPIVRITRATTATTGAIGIQVGD